MKKMEENLKKKISTNIFWLIIRKLKLIKIIRDQSTSNIVNCQAKTILLANKLKVMYLRMIARHILSILNHKSNLYSKWRRRVEMNLLNINK